MQKVASKRFLLMSNFAKKKSYAEKLRNCRTGSATLVHLNGKDSDKPETFVYHFLKSKNDVF